MAETVQATHRLPRPSAPRHNARRSRTATAAGRLERRLRAVPSCVALLACRSAPRARVGRGLEHRAAERRGPPGERSVLHLVRQVLRAQLLCRRDQTKVATANREPLEREADGAGVPLVGAPGWRHRRGRSHEQRSSSSKSKPSCITDSRPSSSVLAYSSAARASTRAIRSTFPWRFSAFRCCLFATSTSARTTVVMVNGSDPNGVPFAGSVPTERAAPERVTSAPARRKRDVRQRFSGSAFLRYCRRPSARRADERRSMNASARGRAARRTPPPGGLS